MTRAGAEDYGWENSGLMLVPEALRGYRAFRMSPWSVDLRSVSFCSKKWRQAAGHEAQCDIMKVVDIDAPGPYMGYTVGSKIYDVLEVDNVRKNGSGTITRGARSRYVPLRGWVTEPVVLRVEMAHAAPVPHRGCDCGFYGCYSLDNLVRAPGVRGVAPWGDHHHLVIGAVEAYGRVILGTKGFRAQKMRIIGLAPLSPLLPGLDRLRRLARDTSPETLYHLREVATHLGVPAFSYPYELAEAFPASNVEDIVDRDRYDLGTE